MSIKKNCPDLKTAAVAAFTCMQAHDMPALDTLPLEEQVAIVQHALCKAFDAEYGPLVLDQSDLEQIHQRVVELQTDMAKSMALSEKWSDKSQIEPPKHMERFPFPEEMEDAICLYLYEEGFQNIAPRRNNGFLIRKDTTFYDFESIIFEALDQQCMVYNIETETLDHIKQAVYKRHNEYINAQQNLDPRLRDFPTEDLTPS